MGRRLAKGSIYHGLALLLGAILIVTTGCSSQPGPVTAKPTAGPTEAPASATSPPAVIPNGRYVAAPQQVADILSRLKAEATLSDSERNAIIDTVLVIRGATTFQTSIEILDGAKFVGGQRADQHPFETEGWWPMGRFDDTTIVVDTGCCGIQAYEVHSVDGGFTLKARSPASSSVEAFVRKVVFEASPFKRAP